jgi:hypothetical protein
VLRKAHSTGQVGAMPRRRPSRVSSPSGSNRFSEMTTQEHYWLSPWEKWSRFRRCVAGCGAERPWHPKRRGLTPRLSCLGFPGSFFCTCSLS